MWEDDRNRRGGRWLVNLNKQQRNSDLDNFWLETVSTNYHINLFVTVLLIKLVTVLHRKIRSTITSWRFLTLVVVVSDVVLNRRSL